MAELRRQHPKDPEEFLELCCVLHDYDKARSYAGILSTCTRYADIAHKVVRPLYINGDIDDTRAKSEKFLELLIPLACLGTHGKGHAAVYHVKQMLDNANVREERKKLEAKRQEIWRASQVAEMEEQGLPYHKITIEITDPESMRLFIAFLQSAGTRFSVTENRHFQGPAPDGGSGERIEIEETPRWFHGAFEDLWARVPDASTWRYGFQSDWITRGGITLSEIRELIKQELP